MNIFRTIITVIALIWSTASWGQCSGQFTTGQICGNATASQAPPKGNTLTKLFDFLYGVVPGTVIYRGPSGWTSLPGNSSGTSVLSENASGVPSWIAASGTGTVTSVALALPGIFTVSGSPVTNSGTLTGTLASQSANLVFVSPNGAPGTPTFRTLVLGDLPSIGSNTSLVNATAGSAVPTAQSMPSCSTVTSALIWTTNTGFGCQTITTSLASIAADNLLGNATGGTAAPTAVPLTSCSAAQQALTYNTTTHVFGCNTISGSGTVIAGSSGQMAWYAGNGNVINGNANATISSGALTLGVASTTIGQLILEGSTSGALTITPQATAGTPTWTAGTSNGTPAVTASAPLAITAATGNIAITGVAGQVLGGSGPAFTATPTLGAIGVGTGQVKLAGTTSGVVTFSVADAAGTWTMKLPTSAGSAGQFLSTDGSGNAAWSSPAGGGTVNAGTAGQMAYYAASAAAVSGNASANISSGTLTLGQASTVLGSLVLEGSTSGALTITPQATAGTPTWTAGTASGTPAVTATAPLAIASATGNITITGVAGQVLAGSAPAFTATPTLGASGTLGSLTFGNATSGLLTLQAVTGALGAVTVSLPAATDTLVGKATTDTLTNKTYDTAGTGNSFLINGVAVTTNTGTGAVARATSPTFTTPTLGVASATTINKVTFTTPATGSTLTIADGKTHVVNNSITLAGTDSTTWTGASTNMTLAALNIADQTLTGGANVTSLSQSTGNITVDCGARPLQFITNNGAYTITAPANDGSCILMVTNGASAGATTFSGFTVGSSTGDPLTTTNTNKFYVWIGRINSVATYTIKALQP